MKELLFADTSRFAHEFMDGETVVINTETGRLYLFTGLGPWLWQRMARGGTLETVTSEVVARYGNEAADTTQRFLKTLAEAGLLRHAPLTKAVADEDLTVPQPDTFQAPNIELYDDITNIIAMDPIHEVDTKRGWPHRPSRP